jgi:hypothetical protein
LLPGVLLYLTLQPAPHFFISPCLDYRCFPFIQHCLYNPQTVYYTSLFFVRWQHGLLKKLVQLPAAKLQPYAATKSLQAATRPLLFLYVVIRVLFCI